MVVFVGIAVKIFKKVLDIVGYHGKNRKNFNDE